MPYPHVYEHGQYAMYYMDSEDDPQEVMIEEVISPAEIVVRYTGTEDTVTTHPKRLVPLS